MPSVYHSGDGMENQFRRDSSGYFSLYLEVKICPLHGSLKSPVEVYQRFGEGGCEVTVKPLPHLHGGRTNDRGISDTCGTNSSNPLRKIKVHLTPFLVNEREVGGGLRERSTRTVRRSERTGHTE